MSGMTGVSGMVEMSEMAGMTVVNKMNKMDKMDKMSEMDKMNVVNGMNRDGLISHIDFLVRLCLYDTAHAEPLSTAIIYGDALLHASYCPYWHP